MVPSLFTAAMAPPEIVALSVATRPDCLPPETVALAYERTVFYKKDMNWRYLNGILRRWHEAGWHTVHQVEQGEQGGRTPSVKPAAPAGDKDAWMRRYIKR